MTDLGKLLHTFLTDAANQRDQATATRAHITAKGYATSERKRLRIENARSEFIDDITFCAKESTRIITKTALTIDRIPRTN